MKISISGTPASGKSTVAKKVAEKLNLQHFSMGDFQREIAREKGITIRELGLLETKDKSLDKMVDDKQVEIGRERENFVIDSRLGCYFIPDSIKIFVDASEEVRARRRFLQKRDEESFGDEKAALDDMNNREEINRKRFIDFYGFDFLDMDNYDLVVDTSELDVEGAARKIVDFVSGENS